MLEWGRESVFLENNCSADWYHQRRWETAYTAPLSSKCSPLCLPSSVNFLKRDPLIKKPSINWHYTAKIKNCLPQSGYFLSKSALCSNCIHHMSLPKHASLKRPLFKHCCFLSLGCHSYSQIHQFQFHLLPEIFPTFFRQDYLFTHHIIIWREFLTSFFTS